jgi:hypothetical protein
MIRHVLDSVRHWSAADLVQPIHDAVQAVYGGASVEEALADAQAAWGE